MRCYTCLWWCVHLPNSAGYSGFQHCQFQRINIGLVSCGLAWLTVCPTPPTGPHRTLHCGLMRDGGMCDVNWWVRWGTHRATVTWSSWPDEWLLPVNVFRCPVPKELCICCRGTSYDVQHWFSSPGQRICCSIYVHKMTFKGSVT